MNPDYFDKAATAWDDNPVRQKLIEAIRTGIQSAIPLKQTWSALEFGCGTASLSLALAPALGRVVAVDSSTGMIEEARRKIAARRCDAIEPVVLDLTAQPPDPSWRFDLVFSAMALHHIDDVTGLLQTLAQLLLPGGWIAIADLDAEDGSFHADIDVPHNGFSRETIVRHLEQASFGHAHVRHVHAITKNGHTYPVFLAVARL
jgi:ubiquinone/menaquinone biosynthesis C-methylase UbiE